MAVTNGLAVGSCVGIIFYLLTWWTISVIIKSKKEKDVNPLLMLLAIKVFILKFPLLGVGLWFAFKYIAIDPFALIGGIAVTQIAIVVSALNKLFAK
jgi:hypothetical protein